MGVLGLQAFRAEISPQLSFIYQHCSPGAGWFCLPATQLPAYPASQINTPDPGQLGHEYARHRSYHSLLPDLTKPASV